MNTLTRDGGLNTHMDQRYEWLGADSNEEGRLHGWCDDIDFNLELMSLTGMDRVAACV